MRTLRCVVSVRIQANKIFIYLKQNVHLFQKSSHGRTLVPCGHRTHSLPGETKVLLSSSQLPEVDLVHADVLMKFLSRRGFEMKENISDFFPSAS